MKLKIKHVKIENFRCFDNLETDLWDKTEITAANEAGKTTVASAILWALTGKDSEGNSSFEIVPTGKYGKVSPTVTLECMVDDRPVTLQRVYAAKFTRDKKFSDYAVKTYINGIETGVKKFGEWVSQNICDEKVFKILSNPKTFVEDCPKESKELMWQAQRRMLMGIIGGIKTDLEIAKSDEKWSDIVEPLTRYDSASQYLLYLKKRFTESQKALDSYDVRVEQQEKNLAHVEHTKEEIAELVDRLKKEAQATTCRNEEYKAAQQSELAEQIKAEIVALKKEYQEVATKYQEDKELFRSTREKYSADAKSILNELNESMRTLKTYAEAIEKLKGTQVVQVCETCGQRLSEDAIMRTKKKLEERIRNGEKQTAELSNKAMILRKKYDEARNKVRGVMEPTYPVRLDEITSRNAELLEQMSKIPQAQDMPDYTKQMQSIEIKMDALKEEYVLLKRNAEVEREIQHIEEEHNHNVMVMSETQMMLDTTKRFIGAKCSYAEDSINALFENVRFQLFEKNKSNDEVKEVCNLTFRGHKYADLSASTKIIASLEVVRAFREFYNVTVPLIIDNCESITGPIETGTQAILMVVKEERCPKCGGHSGRRNADGTWTCQSCGHVWKKKLEIKEG